MNVSRYATKRCLSPLRTCHSSLNTPKSSNKLKYNDLNVHTSRHLASRPILNSELDKTFHVENKAKQNSEENGENNEKKLSWGDLQFNVTGVIRQTLTSIYTQENLSRLPRSLKGLLPNSSEIHEDVNRMQRHQTKHTASSDLRSSRPLSSNTPSPRLYHAHHHHPHPRCNTHHEHHHLQKHPPHSHTLADTNAKHLSNTNGGIVCNGGVGGGGVVGGGCVGVDGGVGVGGGGVVGVGGSSAGVGTSGVAGVLTRAQRLQNMIYAALTPASSTSSTSSPASSSHSSQSTSSTSPSSSTTRSPSSSSSTSRSPSTLSSQTLSSSSSSEDSKNSATSTTTAIDLPSSGGSNPGDKEGNKNDGDNQKFPSIFKKSDSANKPTSTQHQQTGAAAVNHPKLTLPRRVPWTYKDILPGAMSLITDMMSANPHKSATVKQSIGGASRHHNQHARRDDVDRLSRVLVDRLRPLVMKKHTQQLNACLTSLHNHLIQYERARSIACQAKAIPLFLRSLNSPNLETRRLALSCLALLGYTRSPKGRGIRILSLDGGGTRGLVTIQIMKQLEADTGLPIYKLFDFICGVSTGSLIAVMIGAFKIPLNTVEDIYKEFSTQMFQRGKLYGTGKLVTSHAYYDTQLWQDILTYNFEDMKFSDAMKEYDLPKLAAVSSLTNLEKIQCYVFRNYNFPSGVQSHYMGNSNHKYWEAIRASSAAPGYYEELRIDNLLHQDGGILMNNPTPVAIHESKLLWPKEKLQCVLSIGTGRYESTNQVFADGMSSTLKDKVYKIVQSATDTEAQHTILHDLLDPECYYRMNPYLSYEYGLDEVRPEKWEQMSRDTELYLRRNVDKMNDLVDQLSIKRTPLQHFKDCADKQKLSMGY